MDRPVCLLLFIALVGASAPVQAAVPFEATVDLSLGADYLWMASQASARVLRERWIVGGGVVVLSDYRQAARGALLARTGLALDGGSIGLTIGHAPVQRLLGWSSLEIEASLIHESEALGFEAILRLGGRSIDRSSDAGGASVRGAQLQLEASVERPGTARFELLLDGALYDADLMRLGSSGADLGPLVSFAGRPERWAARALLEVHLREALWLVAALGGTQFASDPGGALLPGLGLRVSSPSGLGVRAGVEVTVPVATAVPARVAFLLEAGWNR